MNLKYFVDSLFYIYCFSNFYYSFYYHTLLIVSFIIYRHLAHNASLQSSIDSLTSENSKLIEQNNIEITIKKKLEETNYINERLVNDLKEQIKKLNEELLKQNESNNLQNSNDLEELKRLHRIELQVCYLLIYLCLLFCAFE